MSTYLGQNFLIDSKIRHRIADHVQKLYHDLQANQLIEIWPGKGAITKLIKDISPNFTVIEKDATMKPGLEEIVQEKGEIIIDDVLKIDVDTELSVSKTLVVGNLPYYITSPILRKFFGNEHPNILGGLFMIQAEVGEKITVDAQKKSYLYRLLNYAYHVQYLKTVPAKAFNPPPKVKSCLVSLVKKAEVPQLSFEALVSFLDAFAPYSRKTLGKIGKMLGKHWEKYTIPQHLAKKRLEEIDWKELEIILQSTANLQSRSKNTNDNK